MFRVMRTTMAAALLAAVLVRPAAADAVERPGWSAGLDLGGGWAGYEAGGRTGENESGFAGGLRAGFAFRPDMSAGADLALWNGEVEGVDWTFLVAGPSFSLYPESGPFYLKGCIGFGNLHGSHGGGDVASENGFGLLGGAGLDLPLRRTVMMTFQANVLYVNAGPDAHAHVAGLTAGFTWYFASARP